MRKVFLKWLGKDSENGLTSGKEYVFHKSPLSCEFVVNDSGATLYTNGLESYWQRIEREVFEAHGFEWFKHTPGDPMPCDGDAGVVLLFQNGESSSSAPAFSWSWDKAWNELGWRYADDAKPVPKDWTEYPHLTAGLTFQPKIEGVQAMPSKPTVSGRNPALVISDEMAGEFMGLDDLPGPSLPETYEKTWPSTERFRNFAWLEFLKRAAPDVAAVEDTSLPPRIRRIVNEKEEAHAAKKKLAKDAQDRALQERADQLADAGRAMDVVDQDHDQRMGWVRK